MRAPYLTCSNFLPHLGEPKAWTVGRHRLDAGKAASLVFERVRAASGAVQSMVLVFPPYLTLEQTHTAAWLAERAGLHITSWLPSTLAAVVAAYAEEAWAGPALVVDIDNHALIWSAVMVADGQARVFETQVVPALGLRTWKERLLNAAADRCVRQSRRDPRESAEAEQTLYDQLDQAMEACGRGQVAELVVQMAQWGQNLMLRPDELATSCVPLVQRALAPMRELRAFLPSSDATGVVLATAVAGRLPGLLAALEETVGAREELPRTISGEEDFGEALLSEENTGRATVSVLGPDALATAAYDLAARGLRGELPRGLLMSAVLPTPVAIEAGPARVQFRNHDYLLRGKTFVLGRQSECDLIFESELYPTVSGRHCEILSERRNYILRDRSRNGTLVNERPVVHEIVLQAGDWIRLGPGGPLVRFLGQSAEHLKLITTA